MASFFTYFTSAYGTLWLVVIALSIFAGERLDVGIFGLLGFPIISFIYAIGRKTMAPVAEYGTTQVANDVIETKKHPLYSEFIEEDQDRQHLYKEDLPRAFHSWLEQRNSSANVS